MTQVARHLRMTSADKERKIEAQRRRRLTRPAVNGRLRHVLGDAEYIDLYNELLAVQGGGCAICDKPPGPRRLHMDHNHSTLEVRGLLCYSCNTKLGFVEKYMGRIMRYLGC